MEDATLPKKKTMKTTNWGCKCGWTGSHDVYCEEITEAVIESARSRIEIMHKGSIPASYAGCPGDRECLKCTNEVPKAAKQPRRQIFNR